MTRFTLVWRGITYHWRTHFAVALGVATAVAVLAGALLVGDSVRGSLREMVLDRIGRTDYAVAAANPFRAQLARELGLEAYGLFALEGIVAHGSSGRAASKVTIYGVDEGFWKFHNVKLSTDAPSGRSVLLSPALAAELAAQAGDPVVVRLDKPSDVPVESLHGRKEDAIRTIRLNVGAVVPARELGEFSLRPSQAAVRALFISLPRMQREIAQPGKTNLILIAGDADVRSTIQAKSQLEDFGIKVKLLAEQQQLSLETSSMVISEALERAAFETARELKLEPKPVLTYLVNSMMVGGREVPYSLVTALDLSLVGGKSGIVINDWTARDLGAKPGDRLTMSYYVWASEGRLSTGNFEAQISAVTSMRGVAADRDFAPEYPGITEARTIHDWDPPFPMDLGKIRKQDEDYWDRYRTTPKAFISLEDGQRLWGTRWGRMTSIRLLPPEGANLGELRTSFAKSLRQKITPSQMGMTIAAVRQEGLAASTGSTDFGQYFLYFSFFLVVSALLLVSLFFKLGVEQRHREAGLLRALGFPLEQVGRMYLLEGLLVAGAGSVLGVLAAAGYAALILYGLRTWWVDAVGTRSLELHLGPVSLLGGMLGGLVTALLVIYFAVRGLRGPSPRQLLHGAGDGDLNSGSTTAKWLAIVFGVSGLSLLGFAAAGKINASGGFFGAGAMLLIAALAFQRHWLGKGVVEPASIWRLGLRNATYRPNRSVLSIALIAFATFLVLALTAFRQEGASADPAKRPGTGGFALIGESVLPLIHNPGVAIGRQELGFSPDAEGQMGGVRIIALRLRPGDDSSCLNLYEPRNPRILGVADDVLFRLPLSAEKIAPKPGEIPAYVDANSLQYVLHKKVGDEIVIEPESGKPVRLRISAAIKDSVFQSEVLIRDADFLAAFPEQQGFRMFLVESPAAKTDALTALMEDRLKDYGLDMQSTVERLNEYHRVENAYLSTFQSLGGLGLLLGTVGLAAVLLRNVLERRRELALLRAVGYQPAQLANLVLAENVLLLTCGLLAGALCAALAIAPALVERAGKLPLFSLLLVLAAVAITGLASSILAVRAAMRSPLLTSLRAE